jgi:hypothetical protein
MLGPSNESQPPTELYVKIDHDGRDYFMIANDKIATLANPDAVSQIGVYRL